MKHLCMSLSQVIHLWFEEFALEDSQICSADSVTLRDSLGIIGKKYYINTNSKKIGANIFLSMVLLLFFSEIDRYIDVYKHTYTYSLYINTSACSLRLRGLSFDVMAK